MVGQAFRPDSRSDEGAVRRFCEPLLGGQKNQNRSPVATTELLKEAKNPYPAKKAVGINLSREVLDYFKELAEEPCLPFQKLIDLYLLDCAKRRKKLSMK